MLIGGSRGGWGIAYSKDISSLSRINFTLAHELGHYLVHRKDYPDGIQCSEDDVVQGLRDIEREADQFTADLLMPFDDFRRQIHAWQAADISALSTCADRYGVSLLAATLRWISYTERRAVLAVSGTAFSSGRVPAKPRGRRAPSSGRRRTWLRCRSSPWQPSRT